MSNTSDPVIRDLETTEKLLAEDIRWDKERLELVHRVAYAAMYLLRKHAPHVDSDWDDNYRGAVRYLNDYLRKLKEEEDT